MIQKMPGFSLESIDGRPYLLPYGQNHADHRRGRALNETELFVWNTLDEVSSENDLFFRYAAHRTLSVSDFQDAKKDLENLLLDFEHRGFLTIDERSRFPEAREPFYKGIRIAGLRIKLLGNPECYSEKLDRFIDMSVVEAGSADLTFVPSTDNPPADDTSRILIRTADRIIAENSSFYTFFYPKYEMIREVRYDTAGGIVRVYMKDTPDDSGKKAALQEQLFQILRTVYLYAASKQRIFALFSTSIVYQNRVWLLAGSTRSFRTRYAELWHTCYGTTIFNSDLNLIGLGKGTPETFSFPWGGQSLRYTTESMKIGGIILLKKDDVSRILPLKNSGKIIQTARHMLAPNWTNAQLHYQYVFTEELLETMPVWKMGCSITESSVDLLKTEIDRLLYGADN